ncbi:MAG: hypothetical protein KDB24_17575 [Microthrixaceae bacterium]|nr:hypothetical protein [Microthrixaceae bacterium]
MTHTHADVPSMSVDIGTNSVNTLLDVPGEPRRRHTYYTRLGAGLEDGGALSEEAMGRAIAVLEQVKAEASEAGVERLVATASSASREATNGAAFLARVAGVLGVTPTVISGAEEARLSFVGALTAEGGEGGQLGRSLPGPVLVVDIGGGSTELAVGRVEDGGPSVTASASLEVGSVRFTERYLHADPPLPEELSDCLSVTEATLDEVLVTNEAFGEAATLVIVAGTAETIAAVELGRWEDGVLHGMRLSKAQVEDVFRTLATEAAEDRRHNPGLPAERVDVIVAGCCILVTIMRRMGFGECVVSIGSVRDGVLREAGDRPVASPSLGSD